MLAFDELIVMWRAITPLGAVEGSRADLLRFDATVFVHDIYAPDFTTEKTLLRRVSRLGCLCGVAPVSL